MAILVESLKLMARADTNLSLQLEISVLPEIYQLHFLLLEISPAIWRRLLVSSDCSIADLHYFIQIAFGWTLHRFTHHAKDYGIYHAGGLIFDSDPKQVRLSKLKLRLKECFKYHCDFGDN